MQTYRQATWKGRLALISFQPYFGSQNRMATTVLFKFNIIQLIPIVRRMEN